MTTLRLFSKYILAFVLSFSMINSANAMYFSDFVYQSVRKGFSPTVVEFIEQGYDINSINEDGNTALCLAIEKNDFASYNRIRRLGANDEPKCIKKLDKAKVKEFATRFEKINSDNSGARVERSNTYSPNAKMAAVVGGGAVAAALLLGSSGGGSSSHSNSGNNSGDSGDDDDDNNCPNGQEFVIDECLPTCPTGTRRQGKVCEAIECPANTHLVGNLCLIDDNINIVNNSDGEVYGVKSIGENVFNLYSSKKYPNTLSNIVIKNTGNGNIYGMYGFGEAQVFNSYVTSDYSEMIGEGNIKIDSSGDGNVYGMFSQIDDITGYKEAINASAFNGGTSYGNIDIKHTGTGDVYGIYGDVRAYNTRADYSGNAYGNINLEGSGNIYGIRGSVAATNALSAWYGGNVEANININSLGDGDVYGMAVNRENVPGAGAGDQNLQSWFAFNSYSVGNHVDGKINIRNQGNGNVYGMYGGQQLYNAKSFGGVAVGAINVVNFGDGDVYGMYIPETDSNGIIENLSDEKTSSVINLVNMGDGVTTGIRGGKLNTIKNTGEININNMGNGTAVGIYGAEGSKIYNNGLIKIHRDSFEDEVDGVTYNPTSVNGGAAYGIYAERASVVVNDEDGQIVITNAGDGAGVYLEFGATLENKGLISFNNVEDSIVNDGVIVDIYGEGLKTEGASVDLKSLGEGSVVLGKGGQFFAKEISGEMGVSSEVVLDGFKDIYVENNALQVENVDNLNLNSKSAMFNVSTRANEHGAYDVVLERKNYADVVTNKSLANLLETSYQDEKGEEVHNEIKKAVTAAAANNEANNLSGNNVLPHFRKEDKLVYNHLSKEINDNLFESDDKNYIAGYKYIDISTNEDGNLVGSEGSVHSAYGLVKNKADNGIVYGLGASIAKLDSEYDNGAKRNSNMFGLWLPLGYDFKNGAKWYSKLYAGYGDGSYDRRSSLGSYSADLKEYQLGLSNEVRYSMNLGNGFNFTPVAELNLLNIHQDGFDEGGKSGALSVDAYNNTSLEGGLGAYLSKDVIFDSDNAIGIRIGGVYYVEFLDPDKGIEVDINGLNTYKTDYREDTSRAVLSAKFDYRYKDLSLYAIVEQEIGNNDAFTLDVGAQYRF